MRYVVLNLMFLIKCVDMMKSPLRIIGGEDSASDEYPYIVRLEIHFPDVENNTSIQVNVLLFCTGSALTPIWTLSAAHCFDYDIKVLNASIITIQKLRSNPADETYAFYIRPRSKTDADSDALSRIDYFVKHKAFRQIKMRNDEIFVNDIALVHHRPVSLQQYGKLASLEFTSLRGHEIILAGYGLVNNSEGELLSILQLEKPLQILNGVVVECPRDRGIYPGLCIARRCGQVIGNTCGGDSGGPVLHPAGIIGVITKGFNCQIALIVRSVRVVSFITPISPYLEWISDRIRESH